MRILIDDEKDYLPDGATPDLIARTWAAGTKVMAWLTEDDELYLDHDLGEIDPAKNGHEIITRFEGLVAFKVKKGLRIPIPHKMICVSNNSQGRIRINQAFDSIRRLAATPRKTSLATPNPLIQQQRSPAPWRKPKM